jgi:hypothetical protein
VLSLWGGWFDPLARLTYNAFFGAVGVENYLPFLVLAVACNLLLAGAAYWYCRRRGLPWTGVGGAALLLFMGPAGSTILTPLNALNALGMATLPAALVLLGRRRRRADVAALILLLVGMGFAGPVVVGVCAGVAVFLLAQRPIAWRRLAVPVIPVAAYLLAYVVLPGGAAAGTPLWDNLLASPRFMVEMAAAAVTGITAQSPEMGGGLLALAALALVLLGPRLSPDARRRALALGAAALASWFLVALARAHTNAPEATRYVVLGAVPLLLIGVELARVAPRGWRAGLGIALVLATVANGKILDLQAFTIRTFSETARAQMGALELGLDTAPPTYTPDSPLLGFVVAADWRTTRLREGSFALRPVELPQASPADRLAIDEVLRQIGNLFITPPVSSADAADTPDPTRCTRLTGPPATVTLDAGPVLLTASGGGPVTVQSWRFSDGPQNAPVVVQPGQAVTAVPQPDVSPVPWKLAVSGVARACPAA